MESQLRPNQYAWALRDTVDLRSNAIRVEKDAQVIILDVYPEAQMCKVQFNRQVGVFKIFDFSHINPQERAYGVESVGNGSKKTLHP